LAAAAIQSSGAALGLDCFAEFTLDLIA
jgi:hypothetical protein